MIICVDFDGTCVSHEFPKVGKDIGSVPVLKALVAAGHKLVLFTMRGDLKFVESKDPGILNVAADYLGAAVKWFEDNNIPLWGINVNPEQSSWTNSPKAYGQLYIDDAALGCPLWSDPLISERPFVDWEMVEFELWRLGVLPGIING